MSLLKKTKDALRIDGGDHDEEIYELIQTAKVLLIEAGARPEKVVDTNPLIRKAIITYCKAEFGTDGKTSERFSWSFEEMKKLISLLSSYTEVG